MSSGVDDRPGTDSRTPTTAPGTARASARLDGSAAAPLKRGETGLVKNAAASSAGAGAGAGPEPAGRRPEGHGMLRADTGVSEDAGNGGVAPVSLAWLEELDRRVRRERLARRVRLRDSGSAAAGLSESNLPPDRGRDVDVPARLRGMLAATSRPGSRAAAAAAAAGPGVSARLGRSDNARGRVWVP